MPLPVDDEAPALLLHLRAGVEGAREEHPLRPCRDVNEAARAGRPVRSGRKSGDVHRPVRPDLEKGQERAVEAARLEMGELVGRGDEGRGVGEPPMMRAGSPGRAMWSSPVVPKTSPAAMGWIVVILRGVPVASKRAPRAARTASGQQSPLEELSATTALPGIAATASTAEL
jgi:hypothetical protein